MTELALSAMTSAILASLTLFLAGLSFRATQDRGSAADLFALYLTFAGLASLLGTVHHGFIEPVGGHPAEGLLQTTTRVILALGAFTLLVSQTRQFLEPRHERIVLALGVLGLVGVLWAVATENANAHLALMAASITVMALTVALHLRGLFVGGGSVSMVLGIGITLAAPLLPLFGGDGVAGLGLSATYHLTLMLGIVFQFLGGRALHRRIP